MVETIIQSSVILIVDDSETTRIILHSFCQKAGFISIHEASNGQEALDFIRQHPTDLVFLDMEMPVMDGLTLCQHLRDEQLLEKLVIIMQTASDKPEMKARAFAAGVTDLISKPLEARETIARMLAHLERRQLRKIADDEYQRIREELKEAVMLQALLQPQEDLVQGIQRDLGLDIAHYYHPVSELAGDYISVRRLYDDRVALVAIDIAGHGLSAALYAFGVHTLLEDYLLSSRSPADVLATMNEKLCDFMTAGKFATAWIAVIDTKAQTMEYASAGAPPPFFLTKGKAQPLESRGHLLGVQVGADYTNHRLTFTKGDVLFIYSDAITESVNTNGTMMPHSEIASVLLEVPPNQEAGTYMKQVMMRFYHEYTNHPTDDISMIVCAF